MKISLPPRAATAVFLLGLGFFFSGVFRFWSYTMDDTFITFRYASHLAVGHGMVFNPGDFPRTEGVTSPFYAATLALPVLLGLDVLTSAKALGVVGSLVSGFVLAVLIARLAEATASVTSSRARLFGALGALMFWANPYVAVHTVSGMETSLGTLTLLVFVLSFWNLLVCGPGRSSRGAVLALALSALSVPLIRPELALLVGVLFASAFVFAPSHRRPVTWAFAGFVAMGSLYFSARYLYFGLPLPLPFYVKQGGVGLHGLRDTFDYLCHIVFLLPLLAGLILYLMLARRRGPPGIVGVFLVMLTLATGVQGAYYLMLRHIMGMRFFQPLHSVILVLAVLGAVMIAARCADKPGRTGVWTRILPIALLLAFCFTAMRSFAAVEDRFVRFYGPAIQRASAIGRALHAAAKGQPLTLALNDCGAIPFYSGFRVTDLAGLNHRAIALDRDPPRAALAELASREMLFVLLASNEAHGLETLRGYERLSSENVLNLGFRYRGSIPVNPSYHLLLFGRPTADVDGVVEALSLAGNLEVSP